MEEIYLVTGAAGFLGREVTKQLTARQKQVIGLRLPGDKKNLLESVIYEMGDVTKPYTLQKFFSHAEGGKKSILIHCAGIVSIASAQENLWAVNVDGTRNIVDLCEKFQINRLVYVSSVHAIPEKEKGQAICEPENFSASYVKGIYGKSKAEATAYVKKAAERGLDAVIAYPSGMIGPGAEAGGYMMETIRAYLKGYFPMPVAGGYDFTDVRDVAKGVIACAQKGRQGEGYILSGEYITIEKMFGILGSVSGKKISRHTIPLGLVKCIAPACEKVCGWMKFPLLVTPYSAYILDANGEFNNDKAVKELGYVHRPIEETLADTVMWIGKK